MWRRQITHFGVLNLHDSFADGLLLPMAHDFWEILSQYRQMAETRTRRILLALGVPATVSDLANFTETMRTWIKPDIFIAISHISFSNSDRADCTILPPTIYEYPANLSISADFPTVSNALKMLGAMARVSNETSLFISFTLQGRLYEPSDPDTNDSTTDNFDVFKPCRETPYDQLVNPAQVCCPDFEGNYHFEPDLHVSFAFRRSTNQALTFDNEHALTEKACHAKKQALLLNFGVAAYDVDYESLDATCQGLGLGRPYRRTLGLKMLNFFLRRYYVTRAEHKVCTSISELLKRRESTLFLL
ncbi:uncharacterized protein LOC144137869 [Haemaphysalis longicornis]